MNYQQKLDVAKNPNTPANVLEALATDEYWSVRHKAAMNQNATDLVKRLYLMTEAESCNTQQI